MAVEGGRRKFFPPCAKAGFGSSLSATRGLSVRILYHHRTAALDGMSVHIERLVSNLRARGHEVCVVGPQAGGADRKGDMEAWVDRLRALLPSAVFELLELAYNIPAYRRLARAADQFQPDILYERNNLFLLAGLASKNAILIVEFARELEIRGMQP